MHKAIILGVGPLDGLGARLGLRFAAEGLKVIVAGRTGEQLEKVVAAIRDAGGEATSVVADATSEQDVAGLFELAGDDLDLAIYNAGNNMPGRIIDMDASYFENAWRVCTFGAFLFGREAVQRMIPRGAGSLFFTGASASLRGRAGFGAFSAAKGGLRNLAQAMAKEYGPEGVHVCHIVVDGAIAGEKIRRRYPDYAERLGKAGMISLDGLTDAFAFLYRQPREAWTFELDLRTAIEQW